MRKRHLIPLAALLATSLGMAPASTLDGGESKTGACVHVPRLQDAPLCILVDHAE